MQVRQTGPMRSPLAPRRGFTIVELTLVLVLLVLLASVTVPRLVGVERRQVQVALDGMQDLLSMFAYRDSLGVQPVAVWRDPSSQSVRLMVREFDPEDPFASAEWLPDRFVQPLRLPQGMEIVSVRFDDRPQPLSEWLLTSLPNSDRPRLELEIAGLDTSATFVLDPHAIAPVRYESGRPAPDVRTPIDLDGLGLDRGEW